jgi:hypothetical protein
MANIRINGIKKPPEKLRWPYRLSTNGDLK